MTLKDIDNKVHEFFLESQKPVLQDDGSLISSQGVYPNAIILTPHQYKQFLIEMFELSSETEIPEGVFIKCFSGLTVVIAEDHIGEPKLIKISASNYRPEKKPDARPGL